LTPRYQRNPINCSRIPNIKKIYHCHTSPYSFCLFCWSNLENNANWIMQYDAFGQQDFVPTLSWTWILHPACIFGLKLLSKTWVFNFNIKSYSWQQFSCLKYLFLLWKCIFFDGVKNNENSYKWCKLWISPMLWCPYFRNHWLKNNTWEIHKTDRICETNHVF